MRDRAGKSRSRWAPSVALLGLVTSVLISGPVRATAASITPEIVYVASANSGPVYGYSAADSGLVAPIRQADNPNDANAFWDPWSVAFDQDGNMYVQTFLSNADTFVFAPNPQRGTKPTRIFELYGPDTQAVGVDGAGYEYVLSGDTCCFVAVGAPGASGKASDDYYVPPVRTIDVGFVASPWSQTLTITNGDDPSAVVTGTPNAIVTNEGGRVGSPKPIRVLSGSNTTLGSCPSFSGCDQVAITTTPSRPLLYAAVSAGRTESHICTFVASANGNVTPSSVIEGASTGLTGKVITGIAVSPVSGDIFVMVKPAQLSGPAEIEVFGPLAHGNVAPIRTFTDSRSRFRGALGIGITEG